MFERIKAWYESGKWTAAQVEAAQAKGWITGEQASAIRDAVDAASADLPASLNRDTAAAADESRA